jgi:RNA polymerase sigma-70 factor (ECF subfamily)
MQAGLQDRPEAALMATIMEEPLERALASLPEALRVCVILVDIEEMEYAEAAAALGIPIGTVRSRLSRARQQLQEQLQSYARNARKVGRE